MRNLNQECIHAFYTAFQRGDYKTMQNQYHSDVEFHDPVFQTLSGKEVKAMWEMLLSRAKDLTVTFHDVKADDHRGTCCWEAVYTFSKTGRKVHNVIYAEFEFQAGRIVKHHDHFSLWRWSGMALGLSGLLFGWSPVIQNKIRRTAREGLMKFIDNR
jgi:ketosteroid isomerase-like protein